MPRQKAQFPDGAADIARRFGLTVKAPRHYETMGLLRPARDGHGWRSYGQAECERLHQVAAPRELGLALADICKLMRGGSGLGEILVMQEPSWRAASLGAPRDGLTFAPSRASLTAHQLR